MDGEKDPQSPVETWRLPTLEDFELVDFEAPVRGRQWSDPHDMDWLYGEAFAAARAEDNEPAQLVYRFFGHLCSMVLRPSDAASVWHPLFSLTDRTRAAGIDDYKGAPVLLLRSLAPRIETLALRARAFDIIWSSDRRYGDAAIAAVETYCAIAHGIMDGRLTSRHGIAAAMHAKTPLHRALQIAWLTTKRTGRPQNVIDTFNRLYDMTRSQGEIGILVHLAKLAIEFDLKDRMTVASELEASANANPLEKFPLAVKAAFDLAAGLYHKRNPDARQRCLLGAVSQTLAMREQVSGPGAESHWVFAALQQLRHIQGQDDLKAGLESELRQLQQAAAAQMAEFSVDLGIGDAPAQVTTHFEGLDLADALWAYALLDQSRDPDRLKAEALELAKLSPLMASMPTSYIDGDGRTVITVPGLPSEGEPDPLWFTHMINRAEDLHRHRRIAARIEPARLAIQAKFAPDQTVFEVILGASSFVPEAQVEVMALGFVRLFQGDFVSAVYLLIPQLEPCLRHILKIHGANPSKRTDESTEQDLSLKNIYVRYRAALEQILSPGLAWEIDRLFNTKPGPALRHEAAHGQLSAGDCYHPNAYYGVWLMFRLCCLFAYPAWNSVVSVALCGE
ncbi:DUF7380 domain-containing protein [Acidocella sp.]|uniref:DUF7380 domain-containing protein n=1 Tax=Acidocella sp. TaxID=50710 RepID=UPI003D022CA1